MGLGVMWGGASKESRGGRHIVRGHGWSAVDLGEEGNISQIWSLCVCMVYVCVCMRVHVSV